MNKIKVTILGAEGYTCQIPRIKEGMEMLGHILSEDSPDIIYSNDPRGYAKALSLKQKFPKAHLILNFLDVPWHIENIKKQTELLVEHFLSKADSVSVISCKVQKDLSTFYKKKIHVIYNPAKDLHLDEKIKKENMFLYVGRANDPVKRIKLTHDTLSKLPNGLKNIKICGSENPGFGDYLGVIPDKDLNTLYNSSKFVLLPSISEGIGLSMIEGMICGAVPITCSDNLTAKEFSPSNFICEPDAESTVKKIKELDQNYDENRKLALKYGKKYKIQFDKKTIAQNIINIFNLSSKKN